MPRITISYRREDSGVITGRIFDRLVAQYGRDAIFRDIDDVPPGVDFREHISAVLDHSDVVLAIIGPRWLGPRGAQNRLGDEADPVRVEIETVLRKGVPLIPVLVLRASMPRVSQLPEPLADFAYRNAVQVDASQDFDVHMLRLIRAIDGILTRGQADTNVGESEKPPASRGEAPGAGAAPAVVASGGDAVAVTANPALTLGAAPLADAARPSRRSLAIPLLIGFTLGAAAGIAGATWLRSPSTAIQAAQRRASDLTTQLADARQKQTTAETAATAARKQTAEQAARADDLQRRLDTERALAAPRQPLAAAPTPAPANAARNAAAAEGEAHWTLEQRREVQQALHMLGYFQGTADGGFGAGTRAAIAQFQAFSVQPETGILSEPQRQTLIETAQRLDALLDQPDTSPEKLAASSIPDAAARYARASAAESGKGVRQDMAEAAYWYALAGAEGDARALANLGTLIVRGQGFAKPDPADAVVLWQAAAARGNAVAMFNLGALYERGIGAPVDLARARAWYERAAAHNHPEAAAALKRLGT